MFKNELKTTKYMVMGSYLSIITLNVNWLMLQPKDKDRPMDIKTRPLYMLSTRDSPQTEGHIQTKIEGWKNAISCKQRPKESRNTNNNIR